MSAFLDDFKLVIRQCDYSNTYKMAWSKAIVELSGQFKNETSDYTVIELNDIATKMFKYYWDQTIYFNLFQSAPSQPPVIVSYVKDIINKYQSDKKDYKPIVFIKAEEIIKTKYKKEFYSSIRKSISNIKENVMPFFLNLNGNKYGFYSIDKKNNAIILKTANLRELYENQQDLFDLINYRWSLMLEDYNSSPRIGKKVRIMDEQEVKRTKGLSTFDKFLDLENKEHICFICGEKIDDNKLSRDHVIPWSYMYSDDLWNLVYVHKECNSSKSNITPSDETIKKLKERNIRLQEEMHKNIENKKISILQEFDYAIEHDYVDKFYSGCKGC
ncbi:MAG: HNH endonuclease [bacterium]|nr:HNH endonuclease [bacterium]